MHKHRIFIIVAAALTAISTFCHGVHSMVDPTEVIPSVEFEVNLDGSSLS